MEALDPYEAPPKCLKDAFKIFHSLNTLENNEDIVDFNEFNLKTPCKELPANHFDEVFSSFLKLPHSNQKGMKKYETDIPGLAIFPSLLPPEVQITLLNRLFHRDLSNPRHKTNLHLHYGISYPEEGRSFFDTSPSDILLEPKDPSVHKQLDMKQIFNKKLRWMTLGGQYDWTKKEYPVELPPKFPEDIAKLVHGICPWMVPQAAITNVYSPGDTLSLHRDVSEEVDAGLVSVSLGCDCLFMIGVEDELSEIGYRYNTLRLHSGDVVYMEGQSRFAWHGVPKIIPSTCPSYLSSWPSNPGQESFPQWQDWMKSKRINLNVRQMQSMRPE